MDPQLFDLFKIGIAIPCTIAGTLFVQHWTRRFLRSDFALATGAARVTAARGDLKQISSALRGLRARFSGLTYVDHRPESDIDRNWSDVFGPFGEEWKALWTREVRRHIDDLSVHSLPPAESLSFDRILNALDDVDYVLSPLGLHLSGKAPLKQGDTVGVLRPATLQLLTAAIDIVESAWNQVPSAELPDCLVEIEEAESLLDERARSDLQESEAYNTRIAAQR